MALWMLVAGWIVFAVLALGAAGFVATSVVEKRWRAVHVAVWLFTPLLGIVLLLLLVDYPQRAWVAGGLFCAACAGAIALTMPIGANPRLRVSGEQDRVDEREAIFHRFVRLRPGTPEYEQFYREHPEKKALDDEIREMPHLAHPGGTTYHDLNAPFILSTFDVIEHMTRDIDWGPESIAEGAIDATPEALTERVKGFARYLGAKLVGTTRLNQAYVYSHIGRSPGPWGDPIALEHPNAIAIAVEMDHEMVGYAPDGALTTETALKYMEAAKVAMVLARYINRLGYEARAHVDGNYRVMCGPIAADAGLGELGRLGLLITPQCGPRVRLSVVTTDMPLVFDEPVTFGVQHFCEFCRKCATCCPSGAVDDGEKRLYKGVEKWQTNQESCYRFWRMLGSDCGVCMSVCPYGHPATFLHNLVRWAIGRNALARRLALLGDDLFYGRRPVNAAPLPAWHAKT